MKWVYVGSSSMYTPHWSLRKDEAKSRGRIHGDAHQCIEQGELAFILTKQKALVCRILTPNGLFLLRTFDVNELDIAKAWVELAVLTARVSGDL